MITFNEHSGKDYARGNFRKSSVFYESWCYSRLKKLKIWKKKDS